MSAIPPGFLYVSSSRCVPHGAGVSQVAAQLVPAGGRNGLYFSNPTGVGGVTATDCWVYPALNAAGQSQTLVGGAAGTFGVPAGGGLLISPAGNGAWMVVGATGSSGAASALEF